MTDKSIEFVANAVIITRQKNLMIFNFTIYPSNLKKKIKNKNLCVFKSFQYIRGGDQNVSALMLQLFNGIRY